MRLTKEQKQNRRELMEISKQIDKERGRDKIRWYNKSMATKQERISRAKEIIESYPSAGKSRVNQYLKAEFGKGLRSSTVLELKRQVAAEKPRLYSELYERGGVPRGYNEIYKGWIRAGFLAFEAREFTLGHGSRYMAFDARAVFDSEPARAARQFRSDLIRQQLAQGWTKKQIRDNIIDFYRRSKKVDPWSHIRAEYKPRKTIDYIDYREKVRRRARARQRRLYRVKK